MAIKKIKNIFNLPGAHSSLQLVPTKAKLRRMFVWLEMSRFGLLLVKKNSDDCAINTLKPSSTVSFGKFFSSYNGQGQKMLNFGFSQKRKLWSFHGGAMGKLSFFGL